MSKKKMAIIIVVSAIIIIYMLISAKKENNSIVLAEEDVLMVEAFLENAGEVGITFLKREIDKGKIVEYAYEIPKEIDMSGHGLCKVNQWKIIENDSQYYIMVSAEESNYVYYFPYSMLEK